MNALGYCSIIAFNQVAKRYLITALHPNIPVYEYCNGLPSGSYEHTICLLHADMSWPGALLRIPYGFWLERLRVAGRLLNGNVNNIQKNILHSRLADAGVPTAAIGPKTEPTTEVLVKTKLNAGGSPDSRINMTWRESLGLGAPPIRVEHGATRGYCVMPLHEAVSRSLIDEEMVVEIFVTNARGLRARAYIFGRTIMVAFECSHATIKHMGGGNDRVTFHFEGGILIDRAGPVKVTEDLATRVERLAQTVANAIKLDFGAIDFVLSDSGEALPIDVNPTPSWNPADDFHFADAAREGLAKLVHSRLYRI